MRCVDCEYHKEFPVTGNHWCEATKRHKRISDKDAYVDAPCKVGKEKEQTMSEDKAIHTLYERIGHLLCEQPYGELGRYLTYYAEDRLYLVFDLWYHGFYLVEAKSPKDAIDKVNCDQLAYLPKGADDEDN